LTRIRLASVADALQQQAPSTTMSEHSQESFIANPFKSRHDCPRSRENRAKTGNISGLYNPISERALRTEILLEKHELRVGGKRV
jgi:hypothetical protein